MHKKKKVCKRQSHATMLQQQSQSPPPPIQEQEEEEEEAETEISQPPVEATDLEFEINKEGAESIGQEEEILQEQPVPQPDVTVPDIPPSNPNPNPPISERQLALAQQKLALLQQNFNPIPFSPNKTLDFSAHEELFSALNLWDFAHLDLSSDIRSDLLALFIANYDPSNQRSFVNGVKISVSGSDLAHALALPTENEKGKFSRELFLRDESKEVIEEFMSNYVLLEDDMCILPEEVVKATQLVKEVQADKVDWAGLMWVLVEKELLEAPRMGSCHYASHLQCLMQCQQPRLFESEVEGMEVPETDSSMEVAMGGADGDGEDECDASMRSLDEFQNVGSERQGPGLSLGLGEDEDLMDGIDDCKGIEDGNWIGEGKDEGFEHCLQRCNSNEERGMQFENLCKGEQVGREEEFPNLERVTSTDLLHAMENPRVSYSPRMNSLDPNTGDFLSTGVDWNKNMSLDPCPGGSLFFENNNGKRHIDNVDIDEDDIARFHQNNPQKRMRSGGLSEEQAPSDFDSYVEHIQCTMGKAKILLADKEQTCLNAHLQLQYLNEVLEEKDHIIRALEKTTVEEQQKWQRAVCQYENELNIIAHLVVGYKKALKETQNRFAEYRKKCPQGDEALYKDVGGTGGLVLTSRELERQQLEREEEMRQMVDEMINRFQYGWSVKLDEYDDLVTMLQRKLVKLEVDVKLIKDRMTESKGKDT